MGLSLSKIPEAQAALRWFSREHQQPHYGPIKVFGGMASAALRMSAQAFGMNRLIMSTVSMNFKSKWP